MVSKKIVMIMVVVAVLLLLFSLVITLYVPSSPSIDFADGNAGSIKLIINPNG